MAWDEDKFEQMNDEMWDSMSAAEQNAYYSWQDAEMAETLFLVVKIVMLAIIIFVAGKLII